MKHLLCILALAIFAIGCGESGPPNPSAACAKANSLCKELGADNLDCAQEQADYDAASDEQKANIDEINKCILASNDCMAASMCYVNALENAFEDLGNDMSGDESAGDESAGDENNGDQIEGDESAETENPGDEG